MQQQSSPPLAGAVPPERSHDFDSRGFRLKLHEWGDPARPPLLLCHGMWDHSRGFDLVAPRLAERFRVVAVDNRGHGDSAWSDGYAWPVDVCDFKRVLEYLGRPAHIMGHSKGASQLLDLACHAPDLVRNIFNMDGVGPPKDGFLRPGEEPEARDHPKHFRQFLDLRRKSKNFQDWKPKATLEELIERRRPMNPRLSEDCLRYITFHAARQSEDGFRWKVDPYAGHGYGPWSPDSIAELWQRLRAPILVVTGDQQDVFGPAKPELIEERLGKLPQLKRATVAGAGHFVHLEKPDAIVDLALGFLEA